MNKNKYPILGQEAICPDGLGRVVKIIPGICGNYSIQIDTYVNNRGCHWDKNNVKLIDYGCVVEWNTHLV